MFEHVEPYAGDPIFALVDAFKADPRPHKVNLVDRHLLRRAGPHPGARERAPRRGQGAGGRRPQAVPADGRRRRLPPRGAAAAVRRRARGAGGEPRRDDPDRRLQRRPEGRRRLPQALVPRQRRVGQRPDLGQPPLDVRGQRLQGAHLPVLRRGDRRRALRRDAGRAARAAGAQHRADARLLPQPDRRRPDARAVGRADPAAEGARRHPLPRPRVPGLRRRHR